VVEDVAHPRSLSFAPLLRVVVVVLLLLLLLLHTAAGLQKQERF